MHCAASRVLKFSGIPDDQIKQYNIKVDEHEGKDVYLRTLELGNKDDNKPILVFTHGFFGSTVYFYRIMKKLTEKFYVYMFDLPGMGASSRTPNFDINFDEK